MSSVVYRPITDKQVPRQNKHNMHTDGANDMGWEDRVLDNREADGPMTRWNPQLTQTPFLRGDTKK